MTHIHIVSNTEVDCGNATYANLLRHYLSKVGYRVTVGLDRRECDIAIVNWHQSVVPIKPYDLESYPAEEVVLIWQNSWPTVDSESVKQMFAEADVVVAHEKVAYNNVVYIPHGILEVEGLSEHLLPDTIGTAGFLFPWKRPDLVVKAAAAAELTPRMICPKYGNMINQEGLLLEWRGICPNTEMVKEFLPEHDVVRLLSEHWFNIFWFESHEASDMVGQTGSARLGIAAQRPMIISEHRKFRMLLEEYPDCFYVAKSPSEVAELSIELADKVWCQALNNIKTPARVVQEQGWSKVVQKWQEVIESL